MNALPAAGLAVRETEIERKRPHCRVNRAQSRL